MAVVELEQLLKAGVHYGHPPSRWNPKTGPFVFERRPNAFIIDLRKTVEQLVKAREYLKEVASAGGEILLVGTKRQCANIVRTLALEHKLHYVSDRWLGGTLTNFETIHGQLNRLREIEQFEASETFKQLTKKELSRFNHEKRKLLRNLEGIRNMNRLPDVLIVVDPRKERNAVREATKMAIPTIALVDTDADPGEVTIAIPANDDSMRSIRLILEKLVEAVAAGRTTVPGSAAQPDASGSAQPDTPAPPAPPQV